MDNADLLALADANLEEFCREHSRWLPPYLIEEHEQALFVSSGTRFPGGAPNCILPRAAPDFDAESLIEQGRAFFGARDRGFSIYAPAHLDAALPGACEARGFVKLSDAPGLVLTDLPDAPQLPDGIELRAVDTPAEQVAFIEVAALGFETLGLPANVSRKLFSQPTRWARPYVHAELVYDHDRPVACALTLFSHGIAGVYWVSTLPEARGRGHGSLITRSISRHALKRGASCVILQASPLGDPIYRKLGYKQFSRYPWYLCTA
jgi:hypothetical protein